MVGKAPAFQFYVNDWTRDLEEHPLEIRGAWITILCKLWWSETRGEITKTVEQWSRILGTSEDKALQVLRYISVTHIGNITENNNEITVISRRMIRDNKEKENNRLRQNRFRNSRKSNKKVTLLSQKNNTVSSSSSSSSKENTNLTVSTKESKPVTEKSQKRISDKSIKELIEDYGELIAWDYINRVELHEKSIGKFYEDIEATVRLWLLKGGIYPREKKPEKKEPKHDLIEEYRTYLQKEKAEYQKWFQRSVVDALKDELQPQSLDTWFKPLLVIDVKDDTLYLYWPAYSIAFVEEHYRGLIEEKLKEAKQRERDKVKKQKIPVKVVITDEVPAEFKGKDDNR